MSITKPEAKEYAPFYAGYIGEVAENDLLAALHNNETHFTELLKTITVEKAEYRYAEGKWSVKELLIHICDAERIFAYRALYIARNDKTEFPGFDENEYVPNSNAKMRSLREIADEFVSVRKATLSLFQSFNEEMLLRTGTANKNLISVRALGFIIAGHAQHHATTLKERYLTK